MNKHKLYYLPRHSALQKSSSRRDTADAHSYAPIVLWPNGSLCIPVTLYLKALYSPGSRHKGNAGTLVTYAKNLSHLVRYCNTRQILFHELDDERITEFVTLLQGELTLKKHVLSKARGATQVRVIARRVFHFLIWLQDYFFISDLISIDGKAQAKINLIVRKIIAKSYSTEYYDHPSLPTPDTQKKRFPVTTPHIEQLFQANIASSQSVYVKRRRAMMIQLARATGARRIELNRIKVDDIRNAYETGSLAISVAKTKRHKIRDIPVLKTQLSPIINFIEGQRSLLIKKTIGKAKDPGNLFLSAYGKPLSDETLTNDMHDLTTLAGIKTSVFLHMFRNRYFTDMAFNLLQGIREFVERKELTAPTEQIILQQMRAFSQHDDDKTLLGYIHAAYKEAKAWDLGERLWKMSQIHDSMVSSLTHLRSELNLESAVGSNHRTFKLLSEFEDQLKCWRDDLMQVGVDHESYFEKLL